MASESQNTQQAKVEPESVPTPQLAENKSQEEKTSDDSLDLRSPWVTCFCVVTFDLEFGQKLEKLFPPRRFTTQEKTNICFLSFPDSTNGVGDTIYTFRFKRSKNANKKNSKKKIPRYLYGYVFFRQQRDDSIARGYLQKSVVLISRRSYYTLFKKVISIMGPMFFEFGPALLEAAFQQCCSWPTWEPGKTVNLAILGKVIDFHVPYCGTTILLSVKSGTIADKDQALNNMQLINLYTSFKSLHKHLWTLWELILLGEPVLVASTSPTSCSDAVLGLISLISPIEYGGDFRPYFTIHDPDFNKFTSTKKLPGCVIGVTNPYFFKALDHWPHVMIIAYETNKNVQDIQDSKKSNETKNEVKTKYNPIYPYDKDVIKQLMVEKDDSILAAAVNNELLRRHFLRITENFIAPLDTYCSSLVPGIKAMSPFKKIPTVRPFMEATFITALIQLDKSTRELEMYRKFIRTSNFITWWRRKKRQAIQQINTKYYESVIQYGVNNYMQEKSNVPKLDLYLRLKEVLKQKKGTLPPDLRNKYEVLIEQVLSLLPEDIKSNLNQNVELKTTDLSDPSH